MDMYGNSLSNPPESLRIDEFLDFSNSNHHFSDVPYFPSLPRDEAAELEWLSQFIDDTTSFHDFPPSHTIPLGIGSHTTSFLPNNNNAYSTDHDIDRNSNSNSNSNSNHRSSDVIPSSSSSSSVAGKSRSKREGNGGEGGVRRCSHCASEKTPQWRTGPLGPKTLCNACGVRFKSGRLVPEYRPAASPTFVLTQHSNSHRKVMELRRQKELFRHQQQEQEQSYRHKHDFRVC